MMIGLVSMLPFLAGFEDPGLRESMDVGAIDLGESRIMIAVSTSVGGPAHVLSLQLSPPEYGEDQNKPSYYRAPPYRRCPIPNQVLVLLFQFAFQMYSRILTKRKSVHTPGSPAVRAMPDSAAFATLLAERPP